MRFSRLSPFIVAGAAFVAAPAGSALASSHMDAPLITFDDPANTTDVYAFVSRAGDREYLTTALAVYPFEEPGIGPNIYRFDDNVLYEIHVALGDDIADGEATISYQFKFETAFLNENTILQSFLGEIGEAVDADGFSPFQNLRQTYTVTKVDRRRGNDDGDYYEDDDDDDDRRNRGRSNRRALLGENLRVPPNNQGLVTPLYNQDNNGENPAREGVKSARDLDSYTHAAIFDIARDYRVFAGQRDDGFYADIQSIFDLDFSFSGPNKPFDSQGGFNVHTIVLNIPLDELGGAKIAGVYATTSRRQVEVRPGEKPAIAKGRFVQVARQGNPLFNEALVQIAGKDLYNRVDPSRDRELFLDFAANPDLAAVLGSTPLVDTNGNSLIVGIYIPDLIKVDLTTGPARLAGQNGFNRLGFFGGDVLKSEVQDPFGNGGLIPGGWPNGRRFGDDVDDYIALLARRRTGAMGENVVGVFTHSGGLPAA